MGKESVTNELDLMERATILSEATGRPVADVLADLADDGVLNMSNATEKKSDLISELQDAARLIEAVQEINRAAGDNTVLNGNGNQTEMKVDTTLEGDIVDRAIQSVHRKAENIKKIAIIFIPVLLLATGGTMEGLGMFGGDDEVSANDNHDDGYYDYGGCLNIDALNYDSYASWDDGTCQFDDNNGGGENCQTNWQWNLYGELRGEDENIIWVDARFEDMAQCSYQMDGKIVMMLKRDGQPYAEKEWDNRFKNIWEVQDQFSDLPEGQYDVELEFKMDGSNWHQNAPSQFVVEDNCVWDLDAGDASAVTVGKDIEVNIVIKQNEPDCSVEVEIMISTYLDNSYRSTIEFDEGESYWIDGEENLTIVLKDLEYGNWSFETRFRPMGGSEYCCVQTNQVELVDSSYQPEPEPEPEPECNGSFYDPHTVVESTNNSSQLTIFWDADWSCDETQFVEVDIFVKWAGNQSYFFSSIAAYNITGQAAGLQSVVVEGLEFGESYQVCLVLWSNSEDGWILHEEWADDISVS
tara:strand:- start:327 stop:1901 length:1575 start_codon:yes stop_codon:yes gene_type:complete